jgi:hypothetical protein
VIFSFEAGSRTKGEKGSVAASKRFYLVATKATDQDYISSTSLGGAIVLISLAVILLLALYKSHRDQA